MAFASQLQPAAAWRSEVNGTGRAPHSLPGLTHHYPHSQSPAKCMNSLSLGDSVSPSSSEESASPTEVNSYRRLGAHATHAERPPLMKRLLGLSGALLNLSDDDSTPLVVDTPTTPTNVSLCLNGGYINEASEAEARSRETRESNREPPNVPTLPTAPTLSTLPSAVVAPTVNNTVPTVPVLPAPRRIIHQETDNDLDFRKCNNIKNCSTSPLEARSSSSGSSCGASRCSGNNNVRAEPELQHAPWFQQGIPREIALEVLSQAPVGSFLVRGSTTQPACFALSVRVPVDFQPHGIAHYLIHRTHKGYKIKGFTKEFSSLSALVTHHSVMPELLPVPLRLTRPPAHARRDHDDIDHVVSPHHTHSPHRTPHHTPHHTPHQTPHHTPQHTPRRAPNSSPAHAPHRTHRAPRHVANFLTQLDV